MKVTSQSGCQTEVPSPEEQLQKERSQKEPGAVGVTPDQRGTSASGRSPRNSRAGDSPEDPKPPLLGCALSHRSVREQKDTLVLFSMAAMKLCPSQQHDKGSGQEPKGRVAALVPPVNATTRVPSERAQVLTTLTAPMRADGATKPLERGFRGRDALRGRCGDQPFAGRGMGGSKP